MSGRELEQLIAPAACAQVVCEACGEPFACGARAEGCWCAEVKLTEAMRAELRERYSSCLCRSCLEGFMARGDGDEESSETKKISAETSKSASLTRK